MIRDDVKARDTAYLRCLWAAVATRLDAWRTDWAAELDGPTASRDVAVVVGPPDRSDRDIFEAFAVALLSGNTRWDRIARVRGELTTPFRDFDPRRFAAVSDDEVDQEILPWFRERCAGAASLRAGLSRLQATARKLTSGSGENTAQHYLRDALRASDGTPEGLAITLGTAQAWKLPGFGIALSAEALRMLGLDLCKPDRHILRAMAAWSLVRFKRWDRKGAFTPPQATAVELRAAMLAVKAIADANGLGVSRTSSVIWNAGAVSGARLTNGDFEAIADICAPSGR